MGIVECFDFYMMWVSDGMIKWVFGVSVNGKLWGKLNMYVYWIGSFDGKEFIVD